jgi:hypothetical protein
MKCPVCHREMEEGSFDLQSGSRIAIFWSTVDLSKGVDTQGTPLMATERLAKTSMLGGTTKIKGCRCRECEAVTLLLPNKNS